MPREPRALVVTVIISQPDTPPAMLAFWIILVAF